ncbi:MAG: hypothetical protein IT204_00420 [Fimbriimonadaceae bacterium]|nr:hypothetical protein [Fimbriimonadaceae bacterium]
MATANDAAWEHYLAARTIALDGRSWSISAEDLRTVTGREPRLLAKFDQPSELPRCLRQAGYTLLPVRHGEYLLAPGDLCCELPPAPAATAFDSDWPFSLETACRGEGESQYIDHAYNAGLLAAFCGSGPLYLTIRGRERTGEFEFLWNGRAVTVEAVQIEVDAGYEGARDLVLVEAKVGRPSHVNVRQLYYPWRHFRQLVPGKTVRPVVLTYDVSTTRYELHEFTFAETADPGSVWPLQSAAYRLYEPERRRLPELREAQADPPRGLVPQADDLNRVVRLLELVEAGCETTEAIAAEWGFDIRQAQYYREAAAYLGLLSPEGWQTTRAGRQVLRAGPRLRRQLLARAVVNSWLVIDCLDRGLPLSAATLGELITALPGPRGEPRYNATTAARRARTLLAWLRWLESEVGCFRRDGDAFLPA